MTGFFFVACGGALGAAGRYAVSLLPVQGGFPVLTLVTNLLGAVLIGFVVGFGSAGGMTPNQTLFWKTGVCGGFTTFSTFSLEALTLLESGHVAAGGAYMALSLGLCLGGVLLGRALGIRAAA